MLSASLSRSLWICALSFPLATPLLAQGGRFTEIAEGQGIVFEHVPGLDQFGDEPLTNAMMRDWCQSGAALGDLDGDLDADLVLCGSLARPAVFENQGPGFVDRTAGSGLGGWSLFRVPALGDYDLDGDLDIFLGALEGGEGPVQGTSRLFRNDGGFTFTDVTVLAGTFGNGHTVYAKWLDLDLDGLPDLYTGEFHGTDNLWYRNNGDGSFSELSQERGLDVGGSTHVLTAFDSDSDGQPDALIGNDYQASLAIGYENNVGDVHLAGTPGGLFSDVSAGSGFDHMNGIMGYALGDVNHDGLMDVYKSNVGINPLSINGGWASGSPWMNGQQTYGIPVSIVRDPSNLSVTGPAVSWGAKFEDFDLNLWADLFVVNGMIPNGAAIRGQQNFFMWNRGPSSGFTFRNLTNKAGLYDLYDDRGLAVGDLNRDGKPDLVITPVAGPTRVFANGLNTGTRGWLVVRPQTATSMPFGQGTEVSFVDSLGYPHVRFVDADAPTASQNEPIAHFGLGSETSVDLTVRFPSGIVLDLPAIAPNQELVVSEPALFAPDARVIPSGTGSETVGLSVFAHDASGTALDATASVTINLAGASPAGPVTHVSGNEFRREFFVPSGPASLRVSASFDGWAPLVAPELHVIDVADIGGTTVLLDTEGVRAGSSDQVQVAIAPKTSTEVSLGSGLTLAATLGGAAPLSGPVDHGDGRYSFSFAAPLGTGSYDLNVSVGGVLLPSLAQVSAAGPCDSAQTEVFLEVGTALNSPAPHQLKARITPRDANGLALGSQAQVSLVVTPDNGSDAATLRGELSHSRGDGAFVFVVEKAAGLPDGSATGSLDVVVDGVVISAMTYAF